MENRLEQPEKESSNIETKVEDIFRKRERLYSKDNKAVHEEITNFLQKKILDKYGLDECQKYAIYDAVVNGRKNQEWSKFPADKFDFSGDDSIEKFLEDLEEKYKDK